MTRVSSITQMGSVRFPEFTGERVYMREFTKAAGLPSDLRRWQDTVDQMLDGVECDGPIYLMVDQGRVSAGAAHRRGGLHVDGYWCPEAGQHGGHRGIGAHGFPSQPSHRHTPQHRHEPGRSPFHSHASGDHGHHLVGAETEGLILASDVFGCRGFIGAYEQLPGDGGDCSHIDTRSLDGVEMEPGRVYAGHTLTMLHESLPVERDAFRTLVRLNVKGWCPKQSDTKELRKS